MINCIIKEGNHRFACHAFFLLLSVLVIMFISSAPAFCYELSGTTTGNLLSGGFTAETNDFSASANADNNYALTIEKDGETFTADSDNAQYLNISGDQIYYTTIDGIAKETTLRCYDVSSGSITDLYAVPIGEGMKNLFVIGDTAYFQSDGTIKSYNLNTGDVATVKGSGEIAAFIPVGNILIFSAYIDDSFQLYGYDLTSNETITLAKQVTTFDVYGNNVFYSDGENGLYRIAITGGSAKQLAKGTIQQIVCSDTAVYWQGTAEDTISSLSFADAEKTTESVDDYTNFAVVDSGIVTSNEEMGEGGSGSSTSSIQLSSLPSGSYKTWKQTDSRWADTIMGTSTIGKKGCLVTSISILLVGSGAEKTNYLSGTFDPSVFATSLNNNGGFDGASLRWWVVNTVEPTFSIPTNGDTIFPTTYTDSQKAAAISAQINAGRYVVIRVSSAKTSEHWLAADYVSGSIVYECDPGYNTSTLFADDYYSVSRIVAFSYSGSTWTGSYGTVATPTISLSGSMVTLSCSTSGASIYYTTDGTTPSKTNGIQAASGTSFSLSNSVMVKAIAVCDNYNNSAVASKACVTCSLPFSDVSSSDWYYLPVAQAYEQCLFKGTSTTTFSPGANTTRGMFVMVLANLADAEREYEYDFSDVDPSAWYAESVNWAAAKGIVSGTSSTTFCPEQNITREQVCSIIVRYASVMGISLTDTETAASFTDASKISSWATDAVATAQKAGLIYGKSNANGTVYFDPQGNATRAEVAAIIVRLATKCK